MKIKSKNSLLVQINRDCNPESLEPLAKFSSLVALLSYRKLKQPNNIAFTFLENGETEASSLTYRELDQQARAIAVRLLSLGITNTSPNSQAKALLLYHSGLDYIAAFFGCLYAGIVAIPAYPPKANRSISRLKAIVEDAQAVVVLTTTSILSKVEHRFATTPELQGLEKVTTDNISSSLSQKWQEPKVSNETLAFFQYTSGSTGSPKGVMVSHGNLLNNLANLDCGWEHTYSSVMVTWLPIFHDMGLIYGVLQPLYKGFSCYLMTPEAFMKKPLRWLQAISRYQATHTAAPNFAYELCVRKSTPEQRQSLDLSSWCVGLNGAEPVRKETLEKFTKAFKPSGFNFDTFCPGYGLAEATLKVTSVRKTENPVFYTIQSELLKQNLVAEITDPRQKQITLVGCGRPVLDTQVAIVHPELLSECKPKEVGEIWVSGSSVTQGYWNRSEETVNTFSAFIKGINKGPFLRTGDLGFLKDGELFITGRLKDLIVIRGGNHYPQDIELTVEKSHVALRPDYGAAFTIDIAGEERLIIVQEIERQYLRKIDVDEVIATIRRAVAQQHQLEVYAVSLLKTASIPKTSSGKIQRSACKTQFTNGVLNTIGEWRKSSKNSIDVVLESDNLDKHSTPANKSQTEKDIQCWFISYLSDRLLVNSQEIDLQLPLNHYGLDSAEMLSLTGDLEDWLGYQIPPQLLYEYSSIEKLTQDLAQKFPS